ncbi:MAG: hypothetical protein HXS54_06150 [Theionarchaea archaeon]|nr:hypothetical protein [Theionarchaea archaeon]DBA34841.1 TPA_asm: hypothetical protein vir521_00047 [Caudoviricetes sp. vir521]
MIVYKIDPGVCTENLGDAQEELVEIIKSFCEVTGNDTFTTCELLNAIKFSQIKMSVQNFYKVFNKLKKKKIVIRVY